MLRKLIVAAAAAACLAVPLALASTTAASAGTGFNCSGCTYLRADDPVYTQYNGWDIKADVAQSPYYMENDNSTWFVLNGCVNVGGVNWCRFEDNNRSCMNATNSTQGLAYAVVRSGCAGGNSAEEWAATRYDATQWYFENRHFGMFLSVDTGSYSGDVIVSGYTFSWSRPGA